MMSWTAGFISVTFVLLAIAIHSVIAREVTLFQAVILFFSYYGVLSVAMCLIFKPKKVARNDFYRPFVTVLIPAKNEELVIEETVRSIAGLNYRKNNRPHYEILVIDDSSRDGTSLILERLAKEIPMLRPLRRTPHEGHPGKSAVLNFGLRHAMGEVVAVFDADTRVDPDFLKKSVSYLYDPQVAGVQGRVRILNAGENFLTSLQDDEFATFAHMVQISKDAYGGVMILAGNGQVTKRADLEEAGGWNELSATDDMDLTIKFLLRKKTIRYVPDAVVWQEGITTVKPLIRQRVRWAEGMLKCLFDYFYPLLVKRDITVMQKIDAIMGLARITVPMGIWVGYLHVILGYTLGYIFTSTVPTYFMDSLPWFFGVVMGAGLLKFKPGANLYTLLRVPVYWAYNFFWVLAVPLGYFNCVKHVKSIEWDKTDHRGVVAVPEGEAAESRQIVGGSAPPATARAQEASPQPTLEQV
jgi:cellulose synthase/poly-beta-1,6-N-acetylglucosamine synthase-like glycosyltransferase